jgi:aldose sugar dehydrogenase
MLPSNAGKLIPELKNNLFVAGLAGQHVSRLVLESNKAIGEERSARSAPRNARCEARPRWPSLAITDRADGRLIRIVLK